MSASDLTMGDRVAVRVDGAWIPMRVTREPQRLVLSDGADETLVVWASAEDRWARARAVGVYPMGAPWPLTDVRAAVRPSTGMETK